MVHGLAIYDIIENLDTVRMPHIPLMETRSSSLLDPRNTVEELISLKYSGRSTEQKN